MIYAFHTTQDNKMIYRMKDITRIEVWAAVSLSVHLVDFLTQLKN
jgi:hypothetical protein